MSTRAAIIAPHPHAGGQYFGIYLHSDGYPSWTGKLLHQFHGTKEKAIDLVSLGDLSGIGSDGTAEAYHRDRGEPWEEVEPLLGGTIYDVSSSIDHNGHVYAWSEAEGHWLHNGKPLAEVLGDPAAA